MSNKPFSIVDIINSMSFFFRYIIVFGKFILILWIGFDVLELYQENPMYRSMATFLFLAVTIWFLLRQIGFNPRIRRGG